MSKPFDRIVERVGALEASGFQRRSDPSASARRDDRALARAIERTSMVTIVVALDLYESADAEHVAAANPHTGYVRNNADNALADGVDLGVGTTTGSKIGTATTQKIGFWNATPVVQPATTGTATGFTAGAGTAVTDESTFTGGVGSTAYRISDVVLALKQAGVLAS